MSPRKILLILRIVFALIALAGVVVHVAWDDLRPHVQRLDKGFKKTLLGDPLRRLGEANEVAAAGEADKAVTMLLDLASDLEGVQFGDRLQPLKTDTLERLTQLYLEGGDTESALASNEKLIELHPRDFIAMARKVRILRTLGRPVEANELAAELYRIGGTSPAGQQLYFDMLVAEGRVDEVVERLLDADADSPLRIDGRGWDFRWRTRPNTPFTNRVDLLPVPAGTVGRYVRTLEFAPPGIAVDALRIDLPGGATMLAGDLSIELVTSSGERFQCDQSDVTHVNHMGKEGSLLRSTGLEDPYFHIVPQDWPDLKGVVAAHVELEVIQPLSKELSAALSPLLAGERRADLVARFGDAQVTILEKSLAR